MLVRSASWHLDLGEPTHKSFLQALIFPRHFPLKVHVFHAGRYQMTHCHSQPRPGSFYSTREFPSEGLSRFLPC